MKSIKILMLILACLCLLSCNAADKEPQLLTIGLMPAVDAAPIYIARDEGYFKELGLTVELDLYTNATDRQSALQSKSIDGTITDIIALINNVENGFELKGTMTTDYSFPVVYSKEFNRQSEKAAAGLMEISVVNYLADRFLGDTYELDKIYINDISARIEMLKSNQLDLAVLPEPMASMAQLAGLEKVVYESEDEYSTNLMAFTEDALQNKSEAIGLFHQAYNKAVDKINRDEAIVREVLVKELGLTPEVKDLMILPQYKKTQVPDEAFVKQLIEWTAKVTDQEIEVSYARLIEDKYIND